MMDDHNVDVAIIGAGKLRWDLRLPMPGKHAEAFPNRSGRNCICPVPLGYASKLPTYSVRKGGLSWWSMECGHVTRVSFIGAEYTD